MSRRTNVLLALAISSVAAAGAARAFTLEQVLSAPYPTDLTTSTDGAVAWVFDARGARNVWVAAPPDYRGKAITSYASDDGQEITDLTFSADGKTLVFIRGGDPNRAGEVPNPRSDPEGSTQAVYAVPAGGGEPKRLGEGAGPAISPKSDRVAFVLKDKVWWAPLDGSQKATQTFMARGTCGSLRWSPDGSRLAFVSARGDHAFVGVFDPAKKIVRYLGPDVDRDGEPVWSPDGKRVAFIRIPASPAGREILRPHREGASWRIELADGDTGEIREIFRADAGRGSVFREVTASNQLLWADGDRVVFPWEKEGWTHLYSVSAAGGGAPVLLTPGAFEAEYVALSADKKNVLYNSNQDDIDRRHLWSVPAAGGRTIALTSGDGLEWAPTAAGRDGAIAFIRAGAKRHPQPVLKPANGPERELASGSVPADFPEGSLVVPEQVIFPATDGLAIHGQLFRPAGKAGERHPAVLFFHGGSIRQMLLGWHYMYYYRNAYAFNQYLASRGFVVLSVNYRSGIGYGMEFREATGFGAAGATEYSDVAGAGLYLRTRPDVDPKRIGLWGGSYGGYLTALGLARASDLFAAGVDLHGVHDWSDWFRIVTREEPKNEEAARLAFESSPMSSISTWRSPVLLIHGDDDRNVPFSETVKLAEALRAKNVEVRELVFPDEIHDFLVLEHWIAAYRAATEFLEAHLKK